MVSRHYAALLSLLIATSAEVGARWGTLVAQLALSSLPL